MMEAKDGIVFSKPRNELQYRDPVVENSTAAYCVNSIAVLQTCHVVQ